MTNLYLRGTRMRLRNACWGIWAGATLLCGLALASSSEGGGYHLLRKYELGAAPGGKEYWDYITLDLASRRLYISHNTEVKVVEADTGRIVGSIAGLKRVHGIALVSHLGKGFISGGGADGVVVFDIKELKVTGHIKTGGNPDCIIYDKFSEVETLRTEFGARNAALDRKTHRIFIDTADFGPAPEPTTDQPHPQPTPV